MNYIDFFKRQAKNLLKDYQTRKPYSDGNITVYEYEPKYFDIDSIFVDFGNLNSIFYKYRCSEDDFKLGKIWRLSFYKISRNKLRVHLL